jgi:hypothetical protein
MKKLMLAAAFVLAATSASLAQGYGVYGPGPAYGYGPAYGPGYYDYAPGYGYGPGYYGSEYGYGYGNQRRGGPGPRVGNGTGAGIGAVR